MKYLLCDFIALKEEEVFKHYISYQRINPKTYFFVRLFNLENGYFGKECCRCGELLVSRKDRASHNFLKHYPEGEVKPVEEKPIKVIKNGDITTYQISFEEHKNEYNFYNAQKIADELLFKVASIFKPNSECQFKADFAIENIQDAPSGVANTADIKTLRYWSTNVYRAVYFNEFVANGIRNDILKRVINNRLTGSSWYFNRFSHLNIKVLSRNLYSATSI